MRPSLLGMRPVERGFLRFFGTAPLASATLLLSASIRLITSRSGSAGAVAISWPSILASIRALKHLLYVDYRSVTGEPEEDVGDGMRLSEAANLQGIGGVLAGPNGAEVGHGVPEDDELSVEHDAGTKPCQARQFRELVRHVPVVPRQEPVAVALEESRRPDAVPLHLEQVLVAVERLRSPGQQGGDEPR